MSRTSPRNNEWLHFFSSYFALDIFRNFLRTRKLLLANSSLSNRAKFKLHTVSLCFHWTRRMKAAFILCVAPKWSKANSALNSLSLSLSLPPSYEFILLERKEIEFCHNWNATSNIFLLFLEKLCRYFGIDNGTARKYVNLRGNTA